MQDYLLNNLEYLRSINCVCSRLVLQLRVCRLMASHEPAPVLLAKPVRDRKEEWWCLREKEDSGPKRRKKIKVKRKNRPQTWMEWRGRGAKEHRKWHDWKGREGFRVSDMVVSWSRRLRPAWLLLMDGRSAGDILLLHQKTYSAKLTLNIMYYHKMILTFSWMQLPHVQCELFLHVLDCVCISSIRARVFSGFSMWQQRSTINAY